MADVDRALAAADQPPRIEAVGDAALLMTIGDRADAGLTSRAHGIAAAVERLRATYPGIGRAVPAHASILVPFDPLRIERSTVHGLLTQSAIDPEPLPALADGGRQRAMVEVPVRYGGVDGPDLDDVARHAGLRASEVVRLHTAGRYDVRFLGFAPGFAYLGGLAPELVTVRRATPRERVPAGSVAIAGVQTAIYPLSMPGGWNLIGRTEMPLFEPLSEPPARLAPGAIVRFVDASAP